MSWHCSGTTNEEMVSKLKDANIIKNIKVESAMLAIDRAKYCHDSNPYQDRPRGIGFSVTISAPHMHAYALSFLTDQLFDGAKALDVGSGSGYLTACMAYMVGVNGLVIGIDHIPQLVEMAVNNVEKDHPEFLENGQIKFLEGDGRLGVPSDGPYNAIHVGAAAESMPYKLIDQLALGGRLICPVVASQGLQKYQHLLQIDKCLDGSLKKKNLMDVTYVLLTDTNTQLQNSS